jgi:hypothetical protein
MEERRRRRRHNNGETGEEKEREKALVGLNWPRFTAVTANKDSAPLTLPKCKLPSHQSYNSLSL